MKRKYELKKRAEKQAETRQRIVEATVALHTTVGPSRTSIAAIAEKAGVQRHTVYAHFPDDATLFAACSAHWEAQNPFPDPSAWVSTDPTERMRQALSDVYAWYERVADDLAKFRRDATLHPANAVLMEEQDRQLAELADALARDWGRRKAVRAAVGHALQFETWRSLVRREGLSRRQAVDAMVRLVNSI